MSIAKRISDIAPSMSLAVADKAREMRAQGIDVISFSTGEPDFPTPEDIKEEGIKWIQKDFTKYSQSNGIPELKEAICEKFARENHVYYEPSQVLVGNGAKQILYEACATLLEEGDEVIIPVPAWVSYFEQVKVCGGVPVFVKGEEENNFRTTAAAIESAITEKTKAIILCSPNNPSGAIIPTEELKKIADLAVKHGIYVLSDEVYEKLNYTDSDIVSIASLNDEIKDLTITINSMSKSFCMTGWRVGYCAANPEVIKGMAAFHGHVTGNVNSFSQKAAAYALENFSDFGYMVNEYTERRKYIVERLNAMPGIACNYPDGAFYVFPNVTGLLGKKYDGKTIETALDVADFLLEKARIACVCGESFGYEGHVRFTFATAMNDIVRGMDRMQKALEELE